MKKRFKPTPAVFRHRRQLDQAAGVFGTLLLGFVQEFAKIAVIPFHLRALHAGVMAQGVRFAALFYAIAGLAGADILTHLVS